MAYKIVVNQNKCIGCGSCVATCPEAFEMKNGKARAIKGRVEKLTCEKMAQDGCPVDAISVD